MIVIESYCAYLILITVLGILVMIPQVYKLLQVVGSDSQKGIRTYYIVGCSVLSAENGDGQVKEIITQTKYHIILFGWICWVPTIDSSACDQ
jgi:hypothetical protein